MELRHLRYFVALAEELNFTRAAESLRIAQPALSRQIKDLEREVGVRLIDRGGTRTALTPAGRVFLDGALATLTAADEAIRLAREEAKEGLTLLRIGYLHPHFDHLIPRVIAAFRLVRPEITVVPMELNPARQADAILRGELEIGLFGLALEADRQGLVHEPFMPPMPMVAALPKGHPLAKRAKLSLSDYDGERLIPISDKTFPGAKSAVAKQLRAAGAKVILLPPAETSTSILGQVAAGLGVSVVPELLIRSAPKGVVFRPMELGITVRYEAAWKAERHTPLFADFLRVLREVATAQ